MVFYLNYVIIGITSMEDGKHGLDELQGTRISTWAPSVSIRDVFSLYIEEYFYMYIYIQLFTTQKQIAVN